MTELEKMQFAKNYIDKMANGINPLTNQHTSENDMINNVHISRCLFYVSDILRQVIENGGEINKSNYKKRGNFYITNDQKFALKTVEHPVYVKDITNEINRVTEINDTKKFAAVWITNWLVSLEMLEVIDGKKHATERGNEIGITTEMRYSQKIGNYYANIYSQTAQSFIYDNIDAILNFRNNSNKKE